MVANENMSEAAMVAADVKPVVNGHRYSEETVELASGSAAAAAAAADGVPAGQAANVRGVAAACDNAESIARATGLAGSNAAAASAAQVGAHAATPAASCASEQTDARAAAPTAQPVLPTFAFQWHITDECDQRCKHCYLFSEDARMACKSMSWDDMLHVLDSCYDFCNRVGRQPYFYITGGDPILHRDFWRLAEELHARGAMWCIMGNPFHLTDEVCARMRALGCRKYQLSLDGATAATHDLFRKPGSFDETLRAAECIKRSGMWLALMSTVSSMNAAELPGMISLAAHAGADVFAFGRYCPTKGQRLEEFHMEPLEYRALLLACQKRIDSLTAAGCTTTFQKKDHLWTLLEWEQGRFAIPEGAACGKVYDGCHCGIAHMTVLPTGDVYACRRMESCIGNVHEESMFDLFMGQNMEAHREFAKFEKCDRCKLRGWCRGCPAVAAGYTGNMYAPDPQCWMEVD